MCKAELSSSGSAVAAAVSSPRTSITTWGMGSVSTCHTGANEIQWLRPAPQSVTAHWQEAVSAKHTSIRRAAGDKTAKYLPSFLGTPSLSCCPGPCLCSAVARSVRMSEARSVKAIALVRLPPTLVMEGIGHRHQSSCILYVELYKDGRTPQ
jgi:hypothetical protein